MRIEGGFFFTGRDTVALPSPVPPILIALPCPSFVPCVTLQGHVATRSDRYRMRGEGEFEEDFASDSEMPDAEEEEGSSADGTGEDESRDDYASGSESVVCRALGNKCSVLAKMLEPCGEAPISPLATAHACPLLPNPHCSSAYLNMWLRSFSRGKSLSHSA